MCARLKGLAKEGPLVSRSTAIFNVEERSMLCKLNSKATDIQILLTELSSNIKNSPGLMNWYEYE